MTDIEKNKKLYEEIDNIPDVRWSPENEKILVDWCDVAQCYKWLHMRSHMHFRWWQTMLTIPSIILSTISGTASFATKSIPPEHQSMASMLIGTINISVGILTTIQQYLKITELNESHRVSSIGWDKLARSIRLELAKPPTERISAKSFLQRSREEFDNLMEISPFILDSIIRIFKKMVKEDVKYLKVNKHKETNNPHRLTQPDICNVITSVEQNRHNWYHNIQTSDTNINLNEDIIERLHSLEQRETEIKNKELELNELNQNIINERDEIVRNNSEHVNNYIKSFENANGRKPEMDDIYNHFAGSINKNFIDWFITTDYSNV